MNDAIDAHLILHVCDISHPDHVVQRKIVLRTLQDLNVPDDKLKSMITVCNKSDLLNQAKSTINQPIENEEEDDVDEEVEGKEEKAEEASGDIDFKNENDLYISCKTGEGLNRLIDLLQERLVVASDRVMREYRVLQGGELYQILAQGDFCTVETMIVDESNPQFIHLKCLFSKAAFSKFQARYPGARKYQLLG